MKLSTALEGFWLDKQLRLSPTTQVWYRLTLTRLQAFLGDPEVEQVGSDDIRRFFASLAPTDGLSKCSVQRRLGRALRLLELDRTRTGYPPHPAQPCAGPHQT